jgi:hypothetical protein
VIVTGLFIAGIALLGDVRTTWSFSAFSVLRYYRVDPNVLLVGVLVIGAALALRASSPLSAARSPRR